MSLFKRMAAVVAVLLLAFSSVAAAEDMRFMDADGSTGYYVDASSIVIGAVTKPDGTPDKDVAEACIAVVKADRNLRYLYRMRFDRAKSTYEILEAKSQAYDTKADLEVEKIIKVEKKKYVATSPMKGLVDFIYELKAQMEREAENAKHY